MTRFWLSTPAVVFMVTATLLPVWSHFMPTIEGKLFPVTSVPWEIEVLGETEDGKTRIYQHFTKVRSCEFLSVNWIDKETRIRINVTPEDSYTVQTLGAGEHRTGPWVTHGDLDKLDAQTVHRCHPLWLTISDVYP